MLGINNQQDRRSPLRSLESIREDTHETRSSRDDHLAGVVVSALKEERETSLIQEGLEGRPS